MSDDRIGRASLFLASGTVVSRILGFVKAAVLVSAIGITGASADAFAVANQLPNTVYVVVAGGVLSAVLVPQIVRAGLHADGGRAYINRLLTLALVILVGITLLATLAAPLLTLLYGIKLDQSTRDLATLFAYWCLPQIFFYGLYTLLGEVLNARRSFGPFTWVPVLNNVVAIAGLVIFMAVWGSDPDGLRDAGSWDPAMIAVLAGSASLGIAVQAVVLFWFWRRIGLRYRPDFRWRGVGLGDAGRMASWTFGMLLLTTFAGLVETNVVGGASGPGSASVAALGNAWLLFMLPHSVITVSIATAYFTRMSEHASIGDLDRVRADFSSATRGIGLIIVLASIVLVLCSYPFATAFVSGASFDTKLVFGNVVVAYMIGLLPFSMLFIVQRTFYALGDTKTPFFFTLFQVVLFSGGALLLLNVLPEFIAIGIALLTSLACVAQVTLATILLRRRLGGIDGWHITSSFVRYTIGAVPAVIVGFVALVLLGGISEDGFAMSGLVPAIVSMALIGIVMSLAYLGTLWLIRTPELRGFAEPVLRRLRRG
ncbi:murein biosynthesis integral membrane protein MurJ [Agromyces mediolanus]|uniref:murein biosynthesis integral membrane protein MurJ n=1 Tax=Agromyces mediolanus TaxID=41986 RepID=UPI00203E2EE8|nr:murein biosynthesis integral membrane protein MurJ [Agromyces mediolanus]MCM3658144.1 murein biosynthesis integral membrane protein MurJ [Agromyces mediolanus]